MKNSRLMVFLQIGIVLACLVVISCQNGSNPIMPNAAQQTANPTMTQMPTNGTNSGTNSTAVIKSGTSSKTTTHGSATEMPAYYDAKLFTINFQELPPKAEQTTLARNGQINNIYQCDFCGFDFISVIDAIPTDGMNPLWLEVQITFNSGFTPHQFFSDNEVLAAAASGEITLTPTSEMYTCSVLGLK